jgi:hypothetical protein
MSLPGYARVGNAFRQCFVLAEGEVQVSEPDFCGAALLSESFCRGI